MAETIGTVIGIIVVVIVIVAPFALIAWLVIWLVRRSNQKAAGSQASRGPVLVNQAPAVAPPGYYADPERQGSQRWWDGQRWARLEVVAEPTAQPERIAIRPGTANVAADAINGTNTDTSIPATQPALAQSQALTVPEATPAESTPALVPVPSAVLVKDGDRIRGVEWFGSGEPVSIAGYTIPGGLIYVGRKLAAPQRSVEPSMINPNLRVNSRLPDTLGRGLNYWPAYDSISPESRAAYLEWLARGRRNPSTPLGYVFLFMYGLERRVLVDMQATDSFHSDLAPIRAEMEALIDVYAEQSYSFQRYAKGFLDVIDMMMSVGSIAAPAKSTSRRLSSNRWIVPLSLKIAIGEIVAAKQPLPAAWALEWAWYNPEFRIRTGAVRCTAEFSDLFTKNYFDTYGDGMKVTPGTTMLGLTYSAASAGIGYAKLKMQNVPDVFALAKPTRALAAIAEEVQESLEAFSRFVGKNPERADSLNGIAFLPQRLIESSKNPDFQALREWLADTVNPEGSEAVAGLELLTRWNPAAPTSLSKAESTPLVQLLGKLHVGIEPDVRFGGPPLSVDSPVVLFPITGDYPLSPSPSYETATTLTHFAAAVSAADGEVSDDEIQTFLPSIESSLDLSVAEKTRLNAHFKWLTASSTKLTGLTKRVALLSDSQRVSLGGLLLSVAAADGKVTASEMMALTKIFGLLGLDQSDIASRVFAVQSSPTAAAREPITVRVATPGAPGVPIPLQPRSAAAAPGTLVLDEETIERTMHESASVSELLRGIFDDDQVELTSSTLPADATPVRPPENPTDQSSFGAPTPPSIAGLDAAHSALVRKLVGLQSLPHLEFEELAQAQNVMPNGAIDTINE
ncbi:MAG: hypothetical protein JWO98_5374, partial [Frankiales bacterium]|nr:hypothetical protein [Frankiales bacterium]